MSSISLLMKTKGQQSMDEVMTFDVIRGIQAKREYYITMCSFSTISKHFGYNNDPRITPEQKAQRKLREARIPKIAGYILSNPDNYVISPITVSIGTRLQFDPYPGLGSDSKAGKLLVPLDAVILVNDGQHRCAAIKSAYEDNPNIGSERVPVVMFEDRGLKRSQQLFADLNQHAVKPTKSLSLLYDHRDTFARFIVTLVNDLDIFYGRTELERTNIGRRSSKFFTLNGVAEATRHLLKLKTKSLDDAKQKLSAEYWDHVSKNIPEWNLLMQNKIKPENLRSEYIHAHTNVLSALGMVGYVLTKNSDWKEILKGLQKINWRKDNPIWEDKVVMDGKMLKNRLGIKRAANEILSLLGVDATVDGDART